MWLLSCRALSLGVAWWATCPAQVLLPQALCGALPPTRLGCLPLPSLWQRGPCNHPSVILIWVLRLPAPPPPCLASLGPAATPAPSCLKGPLALFLPHALGLGTCGAVWGWRAWALPSVFCSKNTVPLTLGTKKGQVPCVGWNTLPSTGSRKATALGLGQGGTSGPDHPHWHGALGRGPKEGGTGGLRTQKVRYRDIPGSWWAQQAPPAPPFSAHLPSWAGTQMPPSLVGRISRGPLPCPSHLQAFCAHLFCQF